MDTQQIVAHLIAERDRLTKAIEALSGPTERRGRPPKNAVASVATTVESTEPKKRRGWTAAAKKAQAAKMKAYWAARKKAK
jgi:hypothetical protein